MGVTGLLLLLVVTACNAADHPKCGIRSSGADAQLSCSRGGLAIGCLRTGLRVGGQVCFDDVSTFQWTVQLDSCGFLACGEQSDLQDSKLIADANTVKSHLESTQASAPVYEAFEKTLLKADKGNARADSLLLANNIQDALLAALNDLHKDPNKRARPEYAHKVGIVRYSLDFTLGGSQERLGGYLTQFCAGYIASMTGEEAALRQALGVDRLSEDDQAQLQRQLGQLEANAKTGKDMSKAMHAADEAIAEGLLAGALWESQRTGWSAALRRHVQLRSLLTHLKASEYEDEYGAAKESSAQAIKAGNYSDQSLGYGSTYFASVLGLLNYDPVRQRLASPARNVVVLGSNLGWQCFFAALMYGVEVDGYEIVPHRHAASLAYQKMFQIDGVRLHLEDATKSDLDWDKVGVVYMTDLLWSAPLREMVLTKVATAALGGTFLVSNRKTEPKWGWESHQAVTITVPVSWSSGHGQTFLVSQTASHEKLSHNHIALGTSTASTAGSPVQHSQ